MLCQSQFDYTQWLTEKCLPINEQQIDSRLKNYKHG
jgi:hypothetical protein